MSLRTRLLLAQAPLALALALVGLLAVLTLRSVGESGMQILADNYRSLLALQRMQEALERIDSGVLLLAAGERERGLGQVSRFRQRFEQELRVQEGNLTEPGEREATAQLRARWGRCQQELEAAVAAEDPRAVRVQYLRATEPALRALESAAAQVLALNQDAMVRKSERQRQQSERANALALGGVLAALALGLGTGVALTRRALQPVTLLGEAVRRLGQGDLDARAQPTGGGELAQLAAEFNAMADSLRRYRESSLGELLQAQAASQAAIDSLPDPVLVFGVDQRLLNLNGAAERLLGPGVEGAPDPLARAAPELREVLERVRRHVLEGRGPFLPRGYEEAVRVEGGEGPSYFLPRGSPVHAERAGIIGATVILQDVTRLKRFDALKNDLVATVAHEFRTPLTSLRMAIHLCAEGAAGPVSGKQEELLFAAREDCERLQTLVDDLLDLQRIQEGRLAMQRRQVGTDELLELGVGPHRMSAEQKGLVLRTSVAAGVGLLEVDPERLGLVLSNLVSNAVRHSAPGGRVEVGVRQEAGRVRFEVRDEGPGVAPEHQRRVFEKFYRVPGAPGGGAGLGLSIVREIVEAHEGEVGLETEPGQGACFWFDVPAVPPSPREGRDERGRA
ncbi:HAMP domain-containing protein [Aggregicoccus sp. 17bor-14]|uniref:sensor histidine kinase n=1 Tax=Myxococcaceae TaxID=31 RepID=UPI00129C1543|nr:MULTISPECIES: ATP-binding protein [Myxococcaceae]MBF5045247.1 HAMP domain-containing protein [Simulacricoccus sp. 17bor-14]MRI90988.1 HAMP domain-containing protein [Aggregicoccus sp. 17bor-14]